MTIKELYDNVQQAYNKTKDASSCDVEVWLQLEDKSIPCEITSIGQYNIIPDMTLTIKPIDDKIYSTKPLTPEEIDYKQKYEKLKQDVIILYNRNIH